MSYNATRARTWHCDAPECGMFERVKVLEYPHAQSAVAFLPKDWLVVSKGHDGFTATHHYCPDHAAKLLAVLDGALCQSVG